MVDLFPLGLVVGSCLAPRKEGAEGAGYIFGDCAGLEGLTLFGDIGATSVGTWCIRGIRHRIYL